MSRSKQWRRCFTNRGSSLRGLKHCVKANACMQTYVSTSAQVETTDATDAAYELLRRALLFSFLRCCNACPIII